jgi:2-keto-3-deoxy-galactonokinase
MSRHVILLTDAHEAPAYELIESLRLAGVTTLIEGLREAGAEVTVSRREVERQGELLDHNSDQSPIAVLYEVVAGADMVELQSAIEHARTFWGDTPLIACRRQSSGYHGLSLRSLDGTTLKRLGFRAIADKAAQLPAILREI